MKQEFVLLGKNSEKKIPLSLHKYNTSHLREKTHSGEIGVKIERFCGESRAKIWSW